MSDGVPFQEGPLHPRRAKERIQALWGRGTVTWGTHLEEELANDKLEMTDVEYLIRCGRVVEWSRPGRRWRYTLEGLLLDQRRAACVVEINGLLIIVTAFLVKPRLPGR